MELELVRRQKQNYLAKEEKGAELCMRPAVCDLSIGDNHAQIVFRERAFMDQFERDPDEEFD